MIFAAVSLAFSLGLVLILAASWLSRRPSHICAQCGSDGDLNQKLSRYSCECGNIWYV